MAAKSDVVQDVLQQLELIRKQKPDVWRHLVGLIREMAKA